MRKKIAVRRDTQQHTGDIHMWTLWHERAYSHIIAPLTYGFDRTEGGAREKSNFCSWKHERWEVKDRVGGYRLRRKKMRIWLRPRPFRSLSLSVYYARSSALEMVVVIGSRFSFLDCVRSLSRYRFSPPSSLYGARFVMCSHSSSPIVADAQQLHCMGVWW